MLAKIGHARPETVRRRHIEWVEALHSSSLVRSTTRRPCAFELSDNWLGLGRTHMSARRHTGLSSCTPVLVPLPTPPQEHEQAGVLRPHMLDFIRNEVSPSDLLPLAH